MVKLSGEMPAWEKRVLEKRLEELAENLSRIMCADVSVLALVTGSPPVKYSSGGRVELPRKETDL